MPSTDYARVFNDQGSCFLNNVLEKVMKEYDELLKQYRHQEALYKLSSYKHINNAKLLWRMAQVYCVCAKLEGEKGHQAKRKEMMDEGFHFAERALKLDEKSSECHSWFATMLHFSSESSGIKSSYLNAFRIREHYEKSIMLDPSNAISLHSLGYWCFEFANLPWYQRKILSVLFRAPPSTTFQQALDYFCRAENAKPGFFSMNLVMMGKAHYHLGNYDKARGILNCALGVCPRDPDERMAHAKATEMLKMMDDHHL